MLRSPHTIRFSKALAIAAALTAVLVPAAQAADKSDAVDRYLNSKAASLDVRSPDRKSPAHNWAQPRAMPTDYAKVTANELKQYGIPRAMPSHYGNALEQQVDFRSADTRDAAIGRYPDSGPVLVSVPGGFDWTDATYGAGMTAAALLISGAIAIGLRHRKRIALS